MILVFVLLLRKLVFLLWFVTESDIWIVKRITHVLICEMVASLKMYY